MLLKTHAIVLPFYAPGTRPSPSGPNPLSLYTLTPEQANSLRSPRLHILASNRKGKSTGGMFLQVHGFVSRGAIRGIRSCETIRTCSGCRGRDADNDRGLHQQPRVDSINSSVASRAASNPAKDSCLSRTRSGPAEWACALCGRARWLTPAADGSAGAAAPVWAMRAAAVSCRKSWFLPPRLRARSLRLRTSGLDQAIPASADRLLFPLRTVVSRARFSDARRVVPGLSEAHLLKSRSHRPFQTRGPVAGCGLRRNGWRRFACRWAGRPPSCRRELRSPERPRENQ